MFFSVDERQQRLKKKVFIFERKRNSWRVSYYSPSGDVGTLGTHRERNSRTHFVKDVNIPPRTSLFKQLQTVIMTSI